MLKEHCIVCDIFHKRCSSEGGLFKTVSIHFMKGGGGWVWVRVGMAKRLSMST